MTLRQTGTRRLIAFLIAHARHVMPPDRAIWADAMQREAESIADGKAALSWALGCITASYGERLKAEYFFLPMLARAYLVLVCLRYGLGKFAYIVNATDCQFFGGSYSITIPFNLFLVPGNGFGTPPCGNWNWAEPFFIRPLGLISAGLYFFAALRLAQNRPAAFMAFAGAMLSGLLSAVLAQSIGYHFFNDPNWYFILPWFRPDVLRNLIEVSAFYPLLICIGIGVVVLLMPKSRKTRD
jgi:hypothetical protein